MPERPTLFILDASIDVTGAFVAARRQASLLKGLAECTLVIPQDSRIDPSQLTDFTTVLHLPLRPLRRSIGSLAAYPFACVRNARLLAQALRRSGCERLQVNDYYLLEGALTRLFGFRGRIVTWVRIDPANYGGPVARLWLKAAQAASGRIVAVSRFILSKLPAELGAELLYDPAPDLPLASPPAGRRLVFIGNYIEGKGQDIAIRAFQSVAEHFRDAELLLCGSDMGLERNRTYRQSLEGLASSGVGSDRIVISGPVADPGTVLDGAAAALSLSRSESFSLTTQEASARGVAVIASRCGGPEEIVDHEQTGWLIPVCDVERTAEAMMAALSELDRTHAMGLAGARLVRERFSVAAFRERLAELFDLPRPRD